MIDPGITVIVSQSVTVTLYSANTLSYGVPERFPAKFSARIMEHFIHYYREIGVCDENILETLPKSVQYRILFAKHDVSLGLISYFQDQVTILPALYLMIDRAAYQILEFRRVDVVAVITIDFNVPVSKHFDIPPFSTHLNVYLGGTYIASLVIGWK